MLERKKAVFSNNGELFALLSEQVSLKIWETGSNTLKQEYDLSTHANLICSSLIWGPSQNEINENEEICNSGILDSSQQLLAIGSEKGEIVLYNYNQGKFSYKFDTIHTDSVNDLAWQTDKNVLFSCSSDKFIAAWDLISGKIKVKWEADDEPIYSLSVVDEDSLLSASSKIVWWDIKNQLILKKFDGHDSEIFSLLTLHSTESALNSYFLSVAVGDSKISAWHLKKTNSKSIIATFDVSHKIQSIDITKNFSKDKPMFLSTVTEEGSLLLFEHVLNGKVKKNLKPQMKLHVVTKPSAESSRPSSIPVIASKFSKCSESFIIAYGSFENPVFEKVKIRDCPQILTLSRDKPLQQVNSSNGVLTKMKIYNKVGEFISTNGDLSNSDSVSSPKKRKPKSPKKDAQELSKEITTNVPAHISVSKPAAKKKHSRKRQSQERELNPTDPSDISHRLVQCLESDSTDLFQDVLSQINDDLLIRNTVEKLPHSSLYSFLLELFKLLSSEEHSRFQSVYRKWTKKTLHVHLSYLNTHENTKEVLQKLNKHLDSKEIPETFKKMYTLRGLLSIPRIQSLRLQSDTDSEEEMEV